MNGKGEEKEKERNTPHLPRRPLRRAAEAPSPPTDLNLRVRSFCGSQKADPRNGDGCGVCPCWLWPQPRTRNGAGPRAGLRRGASVQQPLLHRGGRVRDGVVSFTGRLTRFFFYYYLFIVQQPVSLPSFFFTDINKLMTRSERTG